LMYFPSTSVDQEYYFRWQNSPWLDPNEILASYSNWKDTSQWPTSYREKDRVSKAGVKQGDPLNKPGVVGAFNRVYGIVEVLESFLSDVYEPSGGTESRWTYKDGSTAGGLVIYDENTFAYSFHSTDPAGNRLWSAYDLVRLHYFGHLDENINPETPIYQLPSHKAMELMALRDITVKAELEEAKLKEAHADFEDINLEAELDLNVNNPFPVEVFPNPFFDLILHSNKALNFPMDYTAASILSVISTVIGKSAKLRVKAGWEDFASLYIAIVGDAGANKSHPLSMVFQPLQEIDEAAHKRYKEELKQHKDLEAMAKAGGGELGMPAPVLHKTILHDFSPEVLHVRLADNSRGCVIAPEELATFLEGMNKYSKGDQSSIYLSFWSNKPTSIDRISKPIPLLLPEPFLNIIGTIQPRLLPKLFSPDKANSGFLQRFLFTFPSSTRKMPITDDEMDPEINSRYGAWVKKFLEDNAIEINAESNKQIAKIYTWCPKAKEYFYEWHRHNTDLVNDNPDSLKGEVLNKFDVHFIRFSLILQIMEDYRRTEISLKAVEGAAKLCNYFTVCAMRVLKLLDTARPEEFNSTKKKSFYEKLPDQFTTAQANEIGSPMGMNYKAVQRFLGETNLFTKEKHGHYSKKMSKGD